MFLYFKNHLSQEDMLPSILFTTIIPIHPNN